MPIKVVVEFQAKPGARAELKSLLANISEIHGPKAPGFLGSTRYEMLDSPDGLVEIAEWESAEAQAAAVEQATVTGVYAPVIELVAAPFRAIRIGQLSQGFEEPLLWLRDVRSFRRFTHIDHAVIQEAKDAGGYVFTGGLDDDVEPVVVAGDGTATDGTYPQTKELSGLHTAAGDRDLCGALQGRLP